MNYEAFEKACKKNGITPTALSLKIGLKKGNTTSWKKGGNPSVDILIKLSSELHCTTDYLIFGQDADQANPEFTPNEKKCIDKFGKLTEIDQVRVLERMDVMLENY